VPWPLQLIPAKPHILPLVRLVEAIRAGWVAAMQGAPPWPPNRRAAWSPWRRGSR